MSAPSMPPDNSAQVAQIQADSAKQARDEEAAVAKKHSEDLAALRNSSLAAGRTDATNYFQGAGLDPATYSGDIDAQLNSIFAGINPTDENPGQYFKNAGQNIYQNLEKGYQTKNSAALDQMFGSNFEVQKIPYTIDDPYLAGIEGEQRANADAIIKNMLDRGVLTNTGYQAAESDLDRQRPGVQSQLNEFGTGVVAGGQQKLKDVANSARTAAGTIHLGQPFNPQDYSSQEDQVFNDFINTLGQQIRAKVTGNMYNTTGLAALAGGVQGAGNTAFNPAAAAGIIEEPKPKATDTSKESIF
jgi:hypothetical protein